MSVPAETKGSPLQYLIWQIDDHSPLVAQIARAADSFQSRTGLRPTTLMVHAADRERFAALGGLAQEVVEALPGLGTVSAGVFWLGGAV